MPRHRTQNAVSLFPFLAVLVCAMGALILLLLVTTRRIRANTIADLEQPGAIVEEQPAADTNKIQEWESKLADLRIRRSQLLEQQTRQQKKLAAAQADLERLRANVDSLELNVQHAVAEELRQREASQKIAAQHDALIAKIAKTEQEIHRRSERNRAVASRYAVVPFDGRNGTTRRPILIECRKEGMRFMAEDVPIALEHLKPFTPVYNPVLYGTRALIEHWSQQEPESEPYVLLIVRPDGILSYHAARASLRLLQEGFGYELVEERIEIEPPESDPVATEVLREAIVEVLSTAKHSTRGDEIGGSPFRAAATGSGRGALGEMDRKSAELPNSFVKTLPPSNNIVDNNSQNGGEFNGVRQEKPKTAAHRSPSPRGLSSAPRGQSSDTAAKRNPKPGAEDDEVPQLEPLPELVNSERRISDRAPLGGMGLTGRRSGIGFEREVKIRVSAEQVIVGGEFIIRIDGSQSLKEINDEILLAVAAEVRTWGDPPERFRWVPAVNFIVSPGANHIYERTNSSLQKLGLSTSVEYDE